MSTDEFKERIRAIVGAPPPKDKGPCYRKPTDRGYYPPPRLTKKENPNEQKT